MRTIFSALVLLSSVALQPVLAETDIKADIISHLKTSRDFTVAVAEAMPEANYDFKLTPQQMSFAEQMVHLSQAFDYILSTIWGEKPNPPKPPSMKKADVVVFIKSSYDKAIERIGTLTPDQISKSYKSEEGTMTGLDMLLMSLDHATHHRASAEMYLRVKGIKPPDYRF